MTNQFTPEQVEAVAAYAREASKALMRLSGGGSEMFKRIGDEFYAIPGLCVERAEHRFDTIARLRERKASLHQAPGTQPDSGAGPSPASRGSAPAVASKSTRRKDS